jgi:serine/threonine protein kinase
MPYEQQTQGTVNQTVDTYAFAIMLFEMFTSRKPFIPAKGLTFKEARAAIIELHRSEPVPSLVEIRPELPEEIDEIFARALAKNPAERYGEIMEFAGAIHAALLRCCPKNSKISIKFVHKKSFALCKTKSLKWQRPTQAWLSLVALWQLL